jgi:glucokinase
MASVILAGDIGGTKTNLALFEAGSLRRTAFDSFPSQKYETLEEIVEVFLRAHPARPAHACFGVAGPVRDGLAVATNLVWRVEARNVAKRLGLARVGLINDLEANAHGIAALGPKDFEVLSDGRSSVGNAAVIAAGTGLGEAGMFWDGKRHLPFACEGGHTDFAPLNELDIELKRFLAAEFGRVSVERIVSGLGLVNVFRFFRDVRKLEVPGWLEQQMDEGDPAAAVSAAALAHRSDICEQTVATFLRLYGAEAGNLALKMMAVGGLYVGGGIAPKLISLLRGGAFMDAFLEKGRMRPLLEAVPVKVILNDQTALLGAARFATLE